MRRRLIVGLVAVAGALVAARWLPSVPSPFTASAPTAPAAAAAAQDGKAEERFSSLPSRAPLGTPRGALFAAPPPPKPAAAAPQADVKTGPPPMPYRVAGRVVHGGAAKVVLAKGDRVLTVEAGDALEGGYRVEAIGADEITLVYEPLDVRERLPLASGVEPGTPRAPAAAGGSMNPAQLRWDGPARVKAGSVFNLALKLTSSEPLRASPLRLTFDPQLLEAVAVRPGKFFGADASFSYRIDPLGSIVIGASGAAAAAADSELVILSFKPIRSAAAAEVSVASMQLQRAAGAPLLTEPLLAYRTEITP
jgi:hypothetical protein